MAVANFHRHFAGAVDLVAARPVHTIDFEFIANQIVRVTDNDAIGSWIKVDDVTRPGRAAGKSFALPDSEKLDAFVFADEISIDIVNLAATKFVLAQACADPSGFLSGSGLGASVRLFRLRSAEHAPSIDASAITAAVPKPIRLTRRLAKRVTPPLAASLARFCSGAMSLINT